MTGRSLLVAAIVSSAVAPSDANAQIFLESSSRDRSSGWTFDVGAQMARPTGAFHDNVDRGWGMGATIRHHFRAVELLGLRADVGLINYGSENKRVPLSPTVNRVTVNMNTSNNIAVFTGGPELMLSRGPVRPYLFAFAGLSYFYTESSANDVDGGSSFASSVNFDDGGWATGCGGGLRIPTRIRSVDVALDAGARLTRNGTRSYLRPGDVRDGPDGSPTFTPRTTAADFWQYHVAISFSPRLRR